MTASATAMTFTSLQQDIKEYVERGSTGDTSFLRQLPRIINNTERSLADMLKIQGYRDVLQTTLAAQSPVLAKPHGWRNTVTFSIGTGAGLNSFKILRARSYEHIRMIVKDATTYDAPSWYCDYNFDNWLVAPTPAVANPVQLIVYRLPDLLSESNESNYLTQLVPNLLLFSVLCNMEAFLKDDDRLPLWRDMQQRELDAINNQERMKIVDRAQSRTSA